MKHTTRKATRHLNQNEGLIFEKSSAGKAAWKLPPLDVPEVDTAKLLGTSERKDLGSMPEVSEIEIIRHFTRLSTWNYAIDLGMYPLGSCTMKYNPRVNEAVARVEGIANGHPYQPEKISQGALHIIKTLSEQLIEITGMDAITLQPAAGAHGEMTGLLMVRAYQQSKGNARKKILIPDSAHGTNPATAAMVNYAVENLKSDSRGMVDIAALAAQMNEDVAALMLTNPNTLGVFEQDIHKIADILHAKGGLLYMDGANMNALVGKLRKLSNPSCLRRCSPQNRMARWVSTTTDPSRSGACAPFTETSECLCALWLTFRRMAPTACARPPKTPCSMPTIFAKAWKAHTIGLMQRRRCTKSYSATSCSGKKACAPWTLPSV